MTRFSITLSIFALCLCSCNNKQGNTEKETGVKEQVELVKSGLLMTSEQDLTEEQKELKSKIYQVLIEYVTVDTVNYHLKLELSKKDFIDKGLDESLYEECVSNIDDINNYADKSGTGKIIMESWIKSKEEYLKQKK